MLENNKEMLFRTKNWCRTLWYVFTWFCMAPITSVVLCARSQDSSHSVSARRVHVVSYIAWRGIRTFDYSILKRRKAMSLNTWNRGEQASHERHPASLAHIAGFETICALANGFKRWAIRAFVNFDISCKFLVFRIAIFLANLIELLVCYFFLCVNDH